MLPAIFGLVGAIVGGLVSVAGSIYIVGEQADHNEKILEKQVRLQEQGVYREILRTDFSSFLAETDAAFRADEREIREVAVRQARALIRVSAPRQMQVPANELMKAALHGAKPREYYQYRTDFIQQARVSVGPEALSLAQVILQLRDSGQGLTPS